MPKAKYEGIYHSIKKRIEAQDYPYQSLLPSENTLIEEYACSRNTVRRALAELVADGYVQAMQGRGVRVIYQPVGKTTFTIGGIETFQETARRNHLQAVTRVIRFETITATEQFAAESGFSEGDELWAVQRVRYLDGKALILDINYFLKEFVPGLTPEIAANSIYDYIENTLGMQIITSKRRITVEHATVRDEKLLDMDGYDCVAVVVNQTFNSDGMLFEYTQSRHQPDYSAFRTLPRGKSERQTPGAGVSTWDFALGRGSGKKGLLQSLQQETLLPVLHRQERFLCYSKISARVSSCTSPHSCA